MKNFVLFLNIVGFLLFPLKGHTGEIALIDTLSGTMALSKYSLSLIPEKFWLESNARTGIQTLMYLSFPHLNQSSCMLILPVNELDWLDGFKLLLTVEQIAYPSFPSVLWRGGANPDDLIKELIRGSLEQRGKLAGEILLEDQHTSLAPDRKLKIPLTLNSLNVAGRFWQFRLSGKFILKDPTHPPGAAPFFIITFSSSPSLVFDEDATSVKSQTWGRIKAVKGQH